MTPAQRVNAVLRNEMPDRVPFTIYETKTNSQSYEQKLRERGLCTVKRVSSVSLHYPNIKSYSESFDHNGKLRYKHHIVTPHGDLTWITEPDGIFSWTLEHMFKNPDDYKKLGFYLNDMVITENYINNFESLKIDLEEKDTVVRDNIGLEPMQQLINYMGTNEFCIEWMDNRDEIIKLYNILNEKMRKIYPIVAKSPFRFYNYGGNVTPVVIGRDIFEKYYMNVYEEAVEIFHRHGKKIGVHFDADNTPIMDLIGKTRLDYIEAYDVSVGPSLSEAIKHWGDKINWINWPSGYQYHSYEDIINVTKGLIDEAIYKNKFIIAITEDIVPSLQERNLNAILDAIELYGIL